MSNTTETPLLDLLKSVPADARMIYEHSPIESSSIPVGVLAKRAADALETQDAEIEALRSVLKEALDVCVWPGAMITDLHKRACAAIDAGKAVTP